MTADYRFWVVDGDSVERRFRREDEALEWVDSQRSEWREFVETGVASQEECDRFCGRLAVWEIRRRVDES